jgi:peptide/nickel transport system permease protein
VTVQADIPPLDAVETIVSERKVLRRIFANKIAVAALVFLLAIIALAIFAPIIAPYDPDKLNLTELFLPYGSPGHLLGTDELGRDQLSRLIYGTRVSLIAALIAVAVSAGLGVPFGTIAGFVGGRTDALLSRVNDALMSVPALVFAVTIVAVLGRGLVNSMVAVGIVFAPRFFRLARATANELRNEVFIEASVAIGCGTGRIVVRHVLPNAISPIVVQGAFTMGTSLIAEASLSFLGLGVRPPTSSWGSMVGNAFVQIYQAPYLAYAPGAFIMFSVVAFMLVGDGLRKAFGTKLLANND